MTDQVSTREKLRSVREVAAYRPLLCAAIVVLSLSVGALEGIGIGFILPIVTLLQEGAGADPTGPVALFVGAYDAVGLPFTLETVIAGVGGVVGLRYLASFVASWLTVVLRAGYERRLRIRGFEDALEAETAYFDERGADELLNAVLTQTSHASGTITGFVSLVQLSIVSAAYVVVAFYLAPVLMVLTGAVLVALMYGSRYAFESGYDVGERIADANERVQQTVQRGFFGIREVKLFGLADELVDDFRGAVDSQADESIRRQRDMAAISNVNQLLAATTIFLLIYVGASVASLSLASLGVFLFAMFRLAPLLSNLNSTLYGVENDLPHLVRTQAFIDRLERNRESWGDEPVPTPVGRVEFESVEFSYPTDHAGVLHDVSFAVERDELVAFVGSSGAGKSTIASLLSGLYRPTAGRILADSTPIHRFDADEWRSRVAVVRQNPHVFNETLRYNLTIGNRSASPAEIDEACEIAEVAEFLDDLPAGYDTVLGDDGVRLSGGQRQRVAIARALLKDADLLVLDEATSELDNRLETKVHEGIRRVEREYAVIAIAHRLSTVTAADRIHVIKDGEIVETGTHESLVRRDGEYTRLYAAQAADSGSASFGAGE